MDEQEKDVDTSREPRRRPDPGLSGEWIAVGMASLVAARFMVPLLRNLGPHARLELVGLAAVAVPVGAGIRKLRHRRDDREAHRLEERREMRRRIEARRRGGDTG